MVYKTIFILAVMLFTVSGIFGQKQAYFQQDVSYRISAELDDANHFLTGEWMMEYTNNSPDTLDYILMHLWPNAYQSVNTAFAKQQLRYGEDKFYFAESRSRGFLAGVQFENNGTALFAQKDTLNPDIYRIDLAETLLPGASVLLNTDFVLTIPQTVSRLGHIDQSYQMTQWFPKPAVYDVGGWHAMPYLDAGEFYSEFGNFDVQITVPANYIVAGTGVLQNTEAKAFRATRVAETEGLIENLPAGWDTIPSDTLTRLWHFKAENVHDFAWFADKRFLVERQEAELPSGKSIPVFAYFLPSDEGLWMEAAEYAARATVFFSEKIGEYPYPHVSVVEGPLGAGGGMEYPMITIITSMPTAEDLDNVIAHEVGHNWFYGILATNERDYPWMDEGMTSYYEQRYMDVYYAEEKGGGMLPEILQGNSPYDENSLLYLFQKRRGADLPPNTHSNRSRPINYLLGSYVKPPLAFDYLEAYIGTEKLDRIFQKYYDQWGFKHPQPADFRMLVEGEVGEPLPWLFDGLLYGAAKNDIKIKSVLDGNGPLVTLQNKGGIAGPVPLALYSENEEVWRGWVPPFTGTTSFQAPNKDYDAIVIDPDFITLDVNASNNRISRKGLFKKVNPPAFSIVPKVLNPKVNQVAAHPFVGGNAYDGLMVGAMIHNLGLVPKRFEFFATPQYGIGSNALVGMADARLNFAPDGKFIQRVVVGGNYRSYHFNESPLEEIADPYRYQRMVPRVELFLQESELSTISQKITARVIHLNTESPAFDTSFQFSGFENNRAWIPQLEYELRNGRALKPFTFTVNLEQQSYDDAFGRDQNYVRLALEFSGKEVYARGRSFNYRFFAGRQLTNSARDLGRITQGAFFSSGEGVSDYTFSDIYLGRSENTGVLSNMVLMRQGGMKAAFGPSQVNNSGNSNSMLFAVNLGGDLPKDLPFRLPLKPYLDVVWAEDARPIASDASFSDQLWWQGGFTLGWQQFGIHIPVLSSSNIQDLYDSTGRNGFLEKISFSVDFKLLNPREQIEKASLF